MTFLMKLFSVVKKAVSIVTTVLTLLSMMARILEALAA